MEPEHHHDPGFVEGCSQGNQRGAFLDQRSFRVHPAKFAHAYPGVLVDERPYNTRRRLRPIHRDEPNFGLKALLSADKIVKKRRKHLRNWRSRRFQFTVNGLHPGYHLKRSRVSEAFTILPIAVSCDCLVIDRSFSLQHVYLQAIAQRIIQSDQACEELAYRLR